MTTTGRDETELPGDAGDGCHGRDVERTVVDLEPTETGVRKLADDLDPRWRLGERGEGREPAGGTDRRDRLDRPEPGPRHIGGLAPAEQPRERVLDTRRVAGRDQRTGDSRATDRVVASTSCSVRPAARPIRLC